MTKLTESPKVLFGEDEIAERIDALAAEIVQTLPEDLMIVSLLKGSFMFTADLIRALHKHGAYPEIDFLGLRSYYNDTVSSKKVTITQDLSDEVVGRHVLLVDDILESGRTLKFAQNLVSARGAKAISIAVLLEKPGKKALTIEADYTGFTVPDKFVVGYGLDYANKYRQLPYIGLLKQH